MENKKQEFRTDTGTQVKFLKGVGEARARQLGKLGVITVLDLFETFPRSYIQRRVEPAIHDLKAGDSVSLTTMICWVEERKTHRGKTLLNVGISDGKATLVCTWFAYPAAYPNLFTPGGTVWVAATLTEYNGQLQLIDRKSVV